MVAVPKSVRSAQVALFVAARRAMFDHCKDEFAELIANETPVKTAARAVGIPIGLGRELVRQLHYEVWGTYDIV